MNKNITRRDFLHVTGSAGSGLFMASVFESVISQAFAQTMPANTKLIIYGTAHGITNNNLDTTSISKLPEILTPLQKFSSEVTIVRHLFNLAGYQAQIHGNGTLMYTCQDNFNRNSQISIDQEIATAPGFKDMLWPSLPLGLQSGSFFPKTPFQANPSISSKPGQGQVVPFAYPADILKNVFGGAGSTPQQKEEINKIVTGKVNILDKLVSKDARTLIAKLGPEEKSKIDAYFSAVESLGTRLKKMKQEGGSVTTSLPVFSGMKPDKQSGFFIPANEYVDKLDFLVDTAVAALASNLTRIITIGASPYFSAQVMSYIDKETLDYHGMSHRRNFAAAIKRRERFNCQRVADLFSKLKTMPDADGKKMSDNTLIVWVSDHGGAHHRGNFDIPVVLVGNLGGRIDSGKIVRYPKKTNTMSEFWMTVAHAMGHQIPRFGDTKLRCNGVLPNLLKV